MRSELPDYYSYSKFDKIDIISTKKVFKSKSLGSGFLGTMIVSPGSIDINLLSNNFPALSISPFALFT